MGSLEEDELVQMVKDFIESDSSPPAASSSDTSHQIRCSALQEILGSGTEVEMKVLERVLKYMMQSKREVKINGDSLKKWLAMRLRMDGFNAFLCQTSWVNSFGCHAGDYEYIDITVTETENGGTKRLIVDTEFKSQFEVARPTQAYKQLTETLPPIFVGSEEKLNKIISILCSAAKQSLREAGLHVPPWRTASYMQSKWLSAASHTEPEVLGRAKWEQQGKKSGSFSKLLVPTDPSVIKPKRRDLDARSGSALSSQFSNMGINCC